MTPQNVIKSFVDRLANHGYTSSTASAMLDSAVRASSRYTSIDEVIDSIYADHVRAEQAALQTVVSYYLGENTFYSYCVENGSIKQLKDIDSDFLAQTVADNVTLGELVRETTALLFLKQCCGIELYNEDTGAITGSDANVTLTADSFGSNGEQILQVLGELYSNEAALSEDGQTLILGTGTTKTADDVVPENFNTYSAANDAPQKITTGKHGWVVNGTDYNDTITSGGKDFIDAGDGDDRVAVTADGATVTLGAGKDAIAITSAVKEVTIADLAAEDELIINGTFDLGDAHLEDMKLVITDKTGTRKITLGEFQKNTKLSVNKTGTTLGKWLGKFDLPLGDATPAKSSTASLAAVTVNLDDITADDDGNALLNDSIVGELSSSYPDVATFTRNGLTIHLRGEASDIQLSETTPLTFDDLDDDQKTIIAGLFKWWAEEALNLNEESYGVSFNDKASVHDIDLYFFYDAEGSLAAVLPRARSDFDGVTTALFLNINLEPYQNVSPDNVNGASDDWGYLDRTLAHELNHAVLNANINFFSYLPTFIKEGIADLTHGADDDLQQAILRVTRDTDKLAAELDITNNTTQGVTTNTYAAGYVFLRYFAKQAATQTLAMPTFGEIEAVAVDFNSLNVAAGNVLYVDTSTFNPTVQVADDLETFEGLDDPDNVLLALGQIDDLGEGVLYYSIDNDLVKQNITLGGAIANAYGLNAKTSLTGSGGDDAIQVAEGANSISSGDGADYLEVTGQYATIDTGSDDDTIILFDGGHNSINLGDGNNYLELDGEPFADYGYVYSYLYGNSITAGDGNDSIINPTTRYFDEDGYEVTADTEDATAIEFYGYHFDSTIDLGDGDNQINLTSAIDSSIRTGAGNDVISITVLRNSSVTTGAGDDIIVFHGSGNMIDGGAGENAIITSDGSDNTIKTADGSNYISLGAAVESITVEDFGTDDTIILTDVPSELEQEDGNIVAGSVTIAGLDALSTVESVFSAASNKVTYKQATIAGAQLDGSEITYNAGDSKTLFTINGLKSTVGISVDDSDVILTAEALANRSGNTISISGGEDFSLKLDGADGDGVLTLTEAQDAVFEDGTYTAATTAETFTEVDGVITYHAATGGQQFKITGLKDDAQLDEDILVGADGKVTVKASALPEEAVEGATVKLTDLKSGDGVNYSLTFDEDIAQDVTTHKGGWESSNGSNGAFTFTEDYKLARWAKDGNTYTYHNQTGGHQFTISGLNSDVTADKLTNKTISLAGNATTGYTVKILSATLLPTSGAVEVNGIAGIGDVAAAQYKLALDSKIATPKTISESFKETNGKYKYTANGTSAGWSLDNGKIVYSAQVGGEQFELSGIKSGVKLNSGVSVTGNLVKVSSAALKADAKDGTTITLADDTGNYSLQLDSAILQATSEVKGAFTGVSNGKATYAATHTLSYYEPTAANVYTYRKQDAAKKITISNLKKSTTLSDLNALSITEAGGKFTIAFNDGKVLDSKSPSISADKSVTYEVTVADKLNPATLAADWLVKGTNASLKTDTSAGYVVKNNKVVYSGKQTGKPQAVLAGLTSGAKPGVPVNGVLTLKAADLGTKTTLKSNASSYTVELTGSMTGKTFFGSNGSDTLKVTASNAKVSGGAGNDLFTVTSSGAYVNGGTGNDTLNVTGNNVTVNGYKGNDTFNISGRDAVISYTKGDGQDTVSYAQGLTISLSGSMKPLSLDKANGNLILNLGKNDSITVTDVGDSLTVVNKNETLTLDMNKVDRDSNFTFNEKGTAVTVAGSFTGTVTPADDIYLDSGKISKVSTIDAANVTGTVSIVGNGKSNTLLGGHGTTSLTGGKGNDLFVYNGGAMTITDYGDGSDKISLGSHVSSGFAISGDDVLFNFGNDSLRVKDRAGKTITFVEDKSSKTSIYTQAGIFNGAKTAVTLTGSAGDLSGEQKLIVITAGDTFSGKAIVGNDKANIIKGGVNGESLRGGDGNDKIIGNGGSDTLWGGAGADVFVVDGNSSDVIMDYGVGADKVSLDTGMKITDVGVSGKDATLRFTTGDPLKLAGVGDSAVTFVETSLNSKGKKTTATVGYSFGNGKLFNGAKTAVTLTGSAGDLSGEQTLVNVTAGETFSGTSIIGNDKANVIKGSVNGESLRGGAGNDKILGNGGNDTLWGGAGNDTLTGGEGFDTFLYKPGEGKDTITDYESGELLTIMNSTFKSAAFSKNTLTLSIDGGGSVTFKNVSASTSFNINGTTYKVEGKTLA